MTKDAIVASSMDLTCSFLSWLSYETWYYNAFPAPLLAWASNSCLLRHEFTLVLPIDSFLTTHIIITVWCILPLVTINAVSTPVRVLTNIPSPTRTTTSYTYRWAGRYIVSAKPTTRTPAIDCFLMWLDISMAFLPLKPALCYKLQYRDWQFKYHTHFQGLKQSKQTWFGLCICWHRTHAKAESPQCHSPLQTTKIKNQQFVTLKIEKRG